MQDLRSTPGGARTGTTDEETRSAKQARALAAALGGPVELHSVGGQSRTFRITGTDHLVTVGHGWPEEAVPAAELIRRVTLQERVAGRVSVPVPETVSMLPERGLAVVRRLDGDPLISVAPATRGAAWDQVVVAMGVMLAELHTWDAAAYEDVAVTDHYSPEEWRQEAAELADQLAPVLDEGQRRDVRRFLADPAPSPASTSVLSHNDLGIEHVLVARTSRDWRVTGVIDWDDAAICDPAYDFGLLLRDLGPAALALALAVYRAAGASPAGIAERATFYARCKLLEDLAFGHFEDRPEYVSKSQTGWAEVFHSSP